MKIRIIVGAVTVIVALFVGVAISFAVNVENGRDDDTHGSFCGCTAGQPVRFRLMVAAGFGR